MSRSRPSLGTEDPDAIGLRVLPVENASTSTANDLGELPRATTLERSTISNPEEYPSGFKLFAISIGLVLSIFLCALDSTIIATAIPSLTAEFGTIRNIAWYGSAYQVTNAAFQPAWGKAYRYFPLKRVFLLTIAVFELGNVICAAAPNSSTVILGRVVAGVGGGGVMTGAFIIISMTVSSQRRPSYMGILGVTFGCASVAGPLMGGALTDGPGWRWCFWVSLPTGAVAALIMMVCFSEPVNTLAAQIPLRDKVTHTDPVGVLLVTGSLTCFVMAMHWAGSLPWNSAPVVGSLAGFSVMAVAFVVNEWFMGPMGMLQIQLFSKRSILPNLAYSFFLAGVYFPLLFSLPVQFQSINNDSAAQSGIRLIPLVLGVCVFTMITNGLLTMWRHYHPLLIFGSLIGTAGVSMIYTVDADTSTAAWIGFEILTAAGVGIALQTPMLANQDAVSYDEISSVTSVTLFMENLGTTLFVAASEGTFTTVLVSSLRLTVPSVDPGTVIDAGVTQLRDVFHQPTELAGILRAYLDGCKTSHTVSVACGTAAAVVSLVGAWPAGVRTLQTRLRKPHVA